MWGATDENNQRIITAAFQSTLPVWGATLYCADYYEKWKFQSTLPVWGATAEILNKSPAKRDKEQE